MSNDNPERDPANFKVFQPGDVVTWTHCRRGRGTSLGFSTRQGKVVRMSNAPANKFVVVKHRSEELFLHSANVRKFGEPTELTEMFTSMGKPKAGE